MMYSQQIAVCFIYGAVIMGTLCFYAYSPAQPVVALSVILLLFSDLKYHWQNRKYILRGAALGLVLLIPYFRFLILHGRENTRHLEIVGSYLVRNLPPVEKLGIYFKEYIKSLDPLYWFLPHEHDIIRHNHEGLRHLLKCCMPFAAIGLFQVFKNIAKITLPHAVDRIAGGSQRRCPSLAATRPACCLSASLPC